jgi:predicted alpha/beta hydrolase
MSDDEIACEVVCSDGWRLRGSVRLPAGPPRAVVVAGHAMMVDRRTLDRPRRGGLVSFLVERQFAVVWCDLRGHGESGPRAHEGADWSYDDLVERDVPALVGFARQRFPGLPVVALGHSLFGHVTLAHLARHPELALDGLVMLAGNVSNPTWRRRPIAWAQKQVPIEVLGNLALAMTGRLPVRLLRMGTDDESRSYLQQFIRNTRRAAWRARDGFDYFAALGRVRVPTLAVASDGDWLYSPPADVRALMAAVPGARVEVLRGGPSHMGFVLDANAGRPAWELAARFIGEVAAARAA